MRLSEKPFLHADSQAEQPFASKFADTKRTGSVLKLSGRQYQATNSQATDSHVGCIKLTDRQMASSQLTDIQGKQRIAISQTKSDTSLATNSQAWQVTSMCRQPGDRQQTHGCRVTMLDCWTKGKETDAQVQDSQVTSSWKLTAR